jgi:hypothetical protein
MKSELLHLLAKLKSDHPDFQNLILCPNGASMACLQHGYKRFESLDALEAYAWPQPSEAPQALECGGAVQTETPLSLSSPTLPIIHEPTPRTSGYLATLPNPQSQIPNPK